MSLSRPSAESLYVSLFRLTHCKYFQPEELRPSPQGSRKETVRPTCTKPTICCGLLTGIEVSPVIEMNSTIWDGTSVVETPSWLALARMFFRRMMRVAVVPGGSIGTPSQTMEFAPAWRPW